jgi:hypothetical protein
MNRAHPLVVLVSWMLMSLMATAQSIGVGAGIAVPGADVAQLPASVRDGGWRELEHRANQGYFVEARARFGSDFAFVAAVSYNRFEDAVSEYTDGSGRSVSLISSQSIVPVSLGFERSFGDGFVAPYATLEGTMSYFYRAFESRQGETPVPFTLESSGEPRYGLAAGLGAAFDIPLVRFDAFARMQLVNLFGSESTTDESLIHYLQLGVSGYFGL